MRKVPLTRAAFRILKRALWGASRHTVQAQINAGKAEVYESNNHKVLFITRMEGRDLVVVAASGTGLAEVRQELIDFARGKGAHFLRWHTKQPEHLKKATFGLPIVLAEVRQKLFARDEYVFKLGVM